MFAVATRWNVFPLNDKVMKQYKEFRKYETRCSVYKRVFPLWYTIWRALSDQIHKMLPM